MCRNVIVELSPEDEKDARAWRGVFVPVFACLALAIVSAVVLPPLLRSGDQVASVTTSRASAAGTARVPGYK